MRLICFTVFDKAVHAFMTPFFARAKGEGIRMFMEACQDEKHQFFRHAADYTLFVIGEFEDGSGVFTALEDPERLVSALECGPEVVTGSAVRSDTEVVRGNGR